MHGQQWNLADGRALLQSSASSSGGTRKPQLNHMLALVMGRIPDSWAQLLNVQLSAEETAVTSAVVVKGRDGDDSGVYYSFHDLLERI
jgi:hypothetical protein